MRGPLTAGHPPSRTGQAPSGAGLGQPPLPQQPPLPDPASLRRGERSRRERRGLKERVIGQAVFDREAGYDTNQDAVVRNAAAEVRKRLAQYYLEAGPNGYGIRIELPSGTYAPEFRPHLPGIAPEGPSVPAARRIGWLNAVLALAALVALSGWLVTARRDVRPPSTELDRFWAPLLAAQAPVQICVGQSRMYYSPQALPEGPPDMTIPVSRLEPMRDRFLWYGDSVSMAEISGYLLLHHKPYRFRGALVTPYAELLGNPIVLIGAFNNEWTLRLTQGFRFPWRKATRRMSGACATAKKGRRWSGM